MIKELVGIKLLPHPAFIPGLVPSDFFLFRSIVKFFRIEKFKSKGNFENAVQQFFASKPKEHFITITFVTHLKSCQGYAAFSLPPSLDRAHRHKRLPLSGNFGGTPTTEDVF
ncbi:Histone-lysine N-methyltransferase SETMAR [Eumeta japonica]|uniref:Histone-lysine N-methyltransferase SETMAR n=1 Tax=Eumeta variegata TaxID=151549 RepID=A0A4C1Z138_EUMVA|nr:Histone-lysine N-methyltransferase SETMAR [Eumeta japonica]